MLCISLAERCRIGTGIFLWNIHFLCKIGTIDYSFDIHRISISGYICPADVRYNQRDVYLFIGLSVKVLAYMQHFNGVLFLIVCFLILTIFMIFINKLPD